MQQIYNCPQCGGIVQYGIDRCPYCACALYWQPSAEHKQQFSPPPAQPEPPPVARSIPPAEGTVRPQWASQFAPPPPPVTQDKQTALPGSNVKDRPVIYGAMPAQTPSQIPPQGEAAEVIEQPASAQKPASSLIDRIKEALWLTQPPRQAGQSEARYIIRPQTPVAEQQYQSPPDRYSDEQNRREKKDVLVAYLCWLCLGSHYIYLGKTRTQVIFWLTLGGCGLWWLIDGFNLAGMVKDFNIDLLLGNVLQARAGQNIREPKDIKVEKRYPDGKSELK